MAIACGGTGGHLFPGIAVGTELIGRGVQVRLMVSEIEVDQLALKGETRFDVTRLPSVGMGQRGTIRLLTGLWKSYRECRSQFKNYKPSAVLAMGGFTSVAPLLAGKRCGAALFLHDSNAIPGRANRWLSSWVTEAFVGFHEASHFLKSRRVTRTGTPVRDSFIAPASPSAARIALELDPTRPVLLITGGSQGARAINDAIVDSLESLSEQLPELQYLHLTGAADRQAVQLAYQRLNLSARVHPFLASMDLALSAATLAVSRAGGSSLAELAAMRVPAILIPYPSAADDHQTANAQAFAKVHAAFHLTQTEAVSGKLPDAILRLLRDPASSQQMRQGLAQWHVADSARQISNSILQAIGRTTDAPNVSGAKSLLIG